MSDEETEAFEIIESLLGDLTEEDAKILIESLIKEDNPDNYEYNGRNNQTNHK